MFSRQMMEEFDELRHFKVLLGQIKHFLEFKVTCESSLAMEVLQVSFGFLLPLFQLISPDIMNARIVLYFSEWIDGSTKTMTDERSRKVMFT